MAAAEVTAQEPVLARELLANIALARGDVAGARKEIESALAAAPHRVATLITLAHIEKQQGDWPGVVFSARLPAQPVELVCDGPKLSQALTNLLQNAAQAMTENGRAGTITVTLRQEEGSVVIEVEDEGPGFPAERGRLLEPYVTTRGGGTGLGLAIVRKIMEEHTGTVELLSGDAAIGHQHLDVLNSRRLTHGGAASD